MSEERGPFRKRKSWTLRRRFDARRPRGMVKAVMDGVAQRIIDSGIAYPPDLPVSGRREEIIRAIKEHQVVVVAGETGSGKTTQLPKMCIEAGLGRRGKIGCTQPRRVAALSISKRVAQELKLSWGREVGCKIRFQDRSSSETILKFMTDGILLAETQGDAELREYEAIIIDEAHERSLNIDFLLGRLKLLLPLRPELKVIITSATIDTEAFSKAFDNAPIIEVSGRLYPVETIYSPLDEHAQDEGDVTYIDAAANSVNAILEEFEPGDILVFMPTEKDIRETRDILEGRHGDRCEIIPLFGRLSSGDQEKVFSPSDRRRIIVSTNIAETSLTIPRVKYVVDSGLARISRYSPKTRTKRLPIEEIAQSSANQRKGRCGRVANGVCIRLYSEEDFDARPQFTQPEIQRANLAEVILRMKAFHLGEIENFPFLNPPLPHAIKAGYQLLFELGALDEKQSLTPEGWDLARLPVDPSIGRMILQGLRESALQEVLVIAAGLSIQDPRERPMDQKEAAELAHKRFQHPHSDFVALLNIWNAYHDQFDAQATQGQTRRFCKSHFLSYMRMREWRDVHSQLMEAVRSVDLLATYTVRLPDNLELTPPPDGKLTEAKYTSIHRAILSGLLGHVARREDRNTYKVSGDREALIFPGSGLHDRRPPNPKRGSGPKEPQENSTQPAWAVAGEIVETSRLFIRTVARVEPQWVFDLGAHLCKFVHSEPRWDPKGTRVLARERVLLNGMELFSRLVDYGKVDLKAATEVFVRSGLVESEVLAVRHPFWELNRKLCQKIQTWQTRSRRHGLMDLDDRLARFYLRRIPPVSSLHDLNRILREEHQGKCEFLQAQESDLIGREELSLDDSAFPESVEVNRHQLPLSYAYAPGAEEDGVTVRIPITLAQNIPQALLEWAIPGWREEKIRHLLKSLPKSLRVALMPIEPKIKEIVAEFQPSGPSFLGSLAQFIERRYRLPVTQAAWAEGDLPAHLRPRFELVAAGDKPVASGRDWGAIKALVTQKEKQVETNAWQEAVDRFTRHHLTQWNFPDPPEFVEIATESGMPLRGYPGIQADNANAVSLTLFRQRSQAEEATRLGMARLAELELSRDFAWLQKDLRALERVKDLHITLGPGDELQETAFNHLRAHLLDHPNTHPPAKAALDTLVLGAKERIRGLAPRFVDQVQAALKLRHELLLRNKSYPAMRAELDALMPKRFLEHVPFARLAHLPRYLKAMQVRADRAALNPVKDQEKQRLVQPYVDRLRALLAAKDLTPDQHRAVREYRWLVEEMKVSIFAQELGTSGPVSPRRLDAFLEEHNLAKG